MYLRRIRAQLGVEFVVGLDLSDGMIREVKAGWTDGRSPPLFVGDATHQTNWAARNTSFFERDEAVQLQGFDDRPRLVNVASNGREALAVLPQHRPGVVTLDVGLPGMTGIEVLRRLTGRETAVRAWLRTGIRTYLRWVLPALLIAALLIGTPGLTADTPAALPAGTPEGWRTASPREELRPAFHYKSDGGRSGKGAFVIEHD